MTRIHCRMPKKLTPKRAKSKKSSKKQVESKLVFPSEVGSLREDALNASPFSESVSGSSSSSDLPGL